MGVSGDEVRYIGLVTRVISFVVDAALITLVATVVGTASALILAVLHLPQDVITVIGVIGGVISILWLVGYFVVFWSTTGQTPGARVMQIRVVTAAGGPIKPRRALLRCAGVLLAAIPLFAGFIPILYDRKRRGLQDRLAHTLVVEAPAVSIAQTRRAGLGNAPGGRPRQLPPTLPG
jgi:uncharacterized RDD family membrane protein YckC